jgi:2-dehydropantoate 2-reductase
MRVIIYGAGAVGSVIGGRLHQGGANVVLVARPAHTAAIQANGLSLRTAKGTDTVRISAVNAVSELTLQLDDVVIITTKTQDTGTVHDALLAWNPNVAVVCGTNGVEHERMALRRFAHVYGMVIQLPAEFEKPGEVTALCVPTNAILDVGRYPKGTDAISEELAQLINSSPALQSESDPNIMAKKYEKLLLNLGNAAEAASGFAGRLSQVVSAAAGEGKRAYEAAGIQWRAAPDDAARYKARRDTMQFDFPPGDTFLGGSTWQSIMKGASSVETDYFNGEMLLLARLHGTAAPANEYLQNLANRILREKIPAGSIPVETIDAEWAAIAATLPS